MVKVSSKYQVVIPRKIREAMGIRQGDKFQVMQFNNRIELIPYKRIKEMRGFLNGINTTICREKNL